MCVCAGDRKGLAPGRPWRDYKAYLSCSLRSYYGANHAQTLLGPRPRLPQLLQSRPPFWSVHPTGSHGMSTGAKGGRIVQGRAYPHAPRAGHTTMNKLPKFMWLLALRWRVHLGDVLQTSGAMGHLSCSGLVCWLLCERLWVSFWGTFIWPRRLSWNSRLFQAQGSQHLCMPSLLLPSATPLPEPAPPGTSLAVPVVPSQVRHLDLGIDGEDVQTTSTMVLSWGPNFQMLPWRWKNQDHKPINWCICTTVK